MVTDLIASAAEHTRYMLALPDSMGLGNVLGWASIAPSDADQHTPDARVTFGRGTVPERNALLRARWLLQQHAEANGYEEATADERRALWKAMMPSDIDHLVAMHYGGTAARSD